MRKNLKIYPQLLVNVKVKDKNEVMNNAELNQLSDKVSEELGNQGRLLLRQSGTEPLVRVMVEAETDEICKKYVDMVVDKINQISK